MKKFLSLLMTVLTLCSLCLGASAASVEQATIDESRTGSLTIYKYDLTTAQENGLTDSVYLSTGKEHEEAAAAFAPYAIPGVEFTYLRVGAIRTYAADQQIQVVYGVEDDQLLAALGLSDADRTTALDGVNYFASDTLLDALSQALTTHNTTTKNKLEALVSGSDAAHAMPLTDETGKTAADGLELGLYLVVETSVPEEVTYTADPFFVSVPMTDTQKLDNWFYDITVYPKNQTGIPTLEKEVADAAHGLSFSDAEEGYEDVATAFQGDVLNYRILSTLPQIHSDATQLTQYDFVDTLSKGISYNKNQVTLYWYQDAGTAEEDYSAATAENDAANGTHADVTWTADSGYFTVTYGTAAENASTMTIQLTKAGLQQVNTPVNGGDTGRFSDWTLVIYYSATVNADAILGDTGNPNDVTLTWSRTTDGYYDTLEDEAKVYTYGIDLTKILSEGGTDFSAVQFLLQNQSNVTGGFYLTATAEQGGVYFITGSTMEEDKATRFTPNDGGKLFIYGLEEDTYLLTEVKTASGYQLLKDPITIQLSTDYTPGGACGSLTASAAVDGQEAAMTD